MAKKKTKFKKGDRVRIIKGTQYYYGGPGSNNPKDVTGTVTSATGVNVNWDNGTWNGYGEEDLELYSPGDSYSIF